MSTILKLVRRDREFLFEFVLLFVYFVPVLIAITLRVLNMLTPMARTILFLVPNSGLTAAVLYAGQRLGERRRFFEFSFLMYFAAIIPLCAVLFYW